MIAGMGHREGPVLPTALLCLKDQNRGAGCQAASHESDVTAATDASQQPQHRHRSSRALGTSSGVTPPQSAVRCSPHALSLSLYRCCLPERQGPHTPKSNLHSIQNGTP